MSGPVIEKLATWIIEKNPEMSEIPEDLDIVETRTVTSLQFVQFLRYIEDLRGSPIDPADQDIDSFRTLRAIVDTHFAGAEG
ncbi:acyl carrier protein [Streptomyces sp. NPDC048172]|uniref:acyl carrier protein n=1 Tax=Streptomyces sp. NPDC048172 TaxID=3365505 RepID=UPI003721B9A9